MVVWKSSEYEGREQFSIGFGESNLPVSAVTRETRISSKEVLLLCLLMQLNYIYLLLLRLVVKRMK